MSPRAHLKVKHLIGSALAFKHLIRLERPTGETHSRLLQAFVNYTCKKFYIIPLLSDMNIEKLEIQMLLMPCLVQKFDYSSILQVVSGILLIFPIFLSVRLECFAPSHLSNLNWQVRSEPTPVVALLGLNHEIRVASIPNKD